MIISFHLNPAERTFSLQMMRLAYRKSGIQSPEKIRLVTGSRLGRTVGSRTERLSFVTGYTISLTPKGERMLLEASTPDGAWLHVLARVRGFERFGWWGVAWRTLLRRRIPKS